MHTKLALCIALAATAITPSTAAAFCGFYVSGAGGELFNNATQVVMMRDGTRTVLSMQNNYQGPPENFAMVVPVPVVLQKTNVKTLPNEIFKRVDQLAAPRLVEYWEKDPCGVERQYERMAVSKPSAKSVKLGGRSGGGGLGVKVEAQFVVGEYEIVVLSAKFSAGLDTWLKQNNYKIPDGAEPLLRPYVKAGAKFFVAKVNAAKVTFKDGMAKLSPLRFHYDSDEFTLPIRLGLMNSKGKQDLIVHILAPGKRYEVANYKNVTIPTNLNVMNETRDRFGEFYAALYDRTLERNPGAVITEYSWDARSCDPCPTPALRRAELATLGADVLGSNATATTPSAIGRGAPSTTARRPARPRPPRPRPVRSRSFVLTRLHARYGKEITEDLTFRETTPIMGGREVLMGDKLEEGARPARRNNFQGRYAIRHEWTGPINCANPRRGRWGGPPRGHSGKRTPTPAMELAFAPRGKLKLASFVTQGVPEIGVPAASAKPKQVGQTGSPTPANAQPPPTNETKPKQGGCCDAKHGPAGPLLLLLALILLLPRRTARNT